VTYYSHQFARHPIFPYVLYDIILLWETAIGNNLQARKDYWQRAQADILSVGSKDPKAAVQRMRDGEKSGNPVIERLLRNMRLISSYNPVEKLPNATCYSVISSDMVYRFTINPSDLGNPVVLRVAHVYLRPQLPILS
jgi:hypothetical protein